MNGLCHCSEPALRSLLLITMDGLGKEETCGACCEAFHLAHSPLWRTSKKRLQKALAGIQGSNARGRDWTLLWSQLTP